MADFFSKRMQVSEMPMLFVSNDLGKVVVRPGSDGEVNVHGEIKHFRCKVQQHGNEIRITSQMTVEWYEWIYLWVEFLFSGWPKCNLDITVPVESVVQISSQTGHVEISGIKGEAYVQNSTGTVKASDIQGKVNVRASTGNVHIRNVMGDVQADSGTGGVRMENVAGNVAARSNTGSIHFSGILSPEGQHQFTTGTGSIRITLQEPDIAFDATVGTGSVFCYPEKAITRKDTRSVQGYFGNGRGRLMAHTGTGSIHIQG